MHRHCSLISLLILFLVYAPAPQVIGRPAATEPPVALQLQLRDHLGGKAEAVFVQGNYAYAGFGFELAIVDVSTPATPARISFVLLPDTVTDVYVVGHYAYVTCGLAGLWIVDVANPAAPTSVGGMSLPWTSERVVVAKNYAYVVEGTAGGLSIVDVSDPRSPFLVTNYRQGFGHYGLHGLAVVDNLVYLADLSAGLLILDATQPLAIKLLGTYNPPGALYDVAVRNQYAYLVTSLGLRVVDISNPATPTEIGANEPSGGVRVEIVDNYVYVTGGRGTLAILDVTDPAQPTLVSLLETTHDWTTGGYGLAVSGNHVYISNSFYGVHIINVANATAPVVVGLAAYAEPAYPWTAVANNGYVYTREHVVDARDPDHLAVVGTSPGEIRLIAGGYAYAIGAGSVGMQILSLANPTSPSLISSYATDGLVLAISVNYPYAYISDQGYCDTHGGCVGGGLHIVDISDRSAPKRVALYELFAYSLATSGKYLYAVAAGNLHILDVSKPAAPIDVAIYTKPGPGFVEQVTISGRYAYLTAQEGGLHILDISKPTHPIERSVVAIPAVLVVVAEPYAYVQNGLRVHVVDITDAAHPNVVAIHNLPGREETLVSYSLAVDSGTVYLANYGLYAMRLAQVRLTHQVYLSSLADGTR